MKKLFIIIVLLCVVPNSKSAPIADGKLVIGLPYETQGQRNWFVTQTGTGDCTTFDRACKFVTAVAKTSDNYADVIWLGAGDHETDNGSDANGTDIDKDFVTVLGLPGYRTATLYNSDAAAVYILRTTGDHIKIDNVVFNNTGQADEAVIHLNIRAGPAELSNSQFVQVNGATGTGVLIDNDITGVEVNNTKFQGLKTYGLQTDGLAGGIFTDMYFCSCDTAINYAGGANDTNLILRDSFIGKSTTLGIGIDAGTGETAFENISMCDNTGNITDASTHGNAHFFNVDISYPVELIYPADAGTLVSTGDGAWTWTGAATTIIPASTITTPFQITGINVQAYNAAQTYKIDLLYGAATANTRVGIYEFTVAAASANRRTAVNRPVNSLIPANSIVGMKIESSTAGVDTVTVTISYRASN